MWHKVMKWLLGRQEKKQEKKDEGMLVRPTEARINLPPYRYSQPPLLVSRYHRRYKTRRAR